MNKYWKRGVCTIITALLAFAVLSLTSCEQPNDPGIETAATPTANPPAGTYLTAQTVTLSTTTSGASIYYTLDGSAPNPSSSLYNSPFLIPNSSLLKAIATKDGMNDSTILEAAYTIHTHSYSTTWLKDATQHWKECSCGDKTDIANHIVSDWIVDLAATATADGSKHKECTVCGYVTEAEPIPATDPGHTHDYGTAWSSDATQHWHECSCGDKTDIDNHTGDPCAVCGYETIHVHSYSAAWSTNATQHWHECGCGDKTDIANHTGDPCNVCGYSGNGNNGEPVAPALSIDGVAITIPIPAEGVTSITVTAAVSNGAVANFTDPSGILAGKTVNLTLSASANQNNRINYTAISAIEQAFMNKGAAKVESDTAGGAIPVFNTGIDTVGLDSDAITALINSKNVSISNTAAKVVDNIMVLYNSGTPILRVQSPMYLTGTTLCSELARIQADAGMVHADENLRFGSSKTHYMNITLSDFMSVYEKCGFDLNSATNNFLPKPGFVYSGENAINITDTARSWDIYRLFERYHAKGKLNNLTQLLAQDITVAGENANGLYGTDNQPLDTFPYKVNGEVIGFMRGGFRQFENMYEDGTNPIPATISSFNVRNFATKSQLPNTQFYAVSGACFFQYAPPYIESTGAVKFMQVNNSVSVKAKYLDIRNIAPELTYLVRNNIFSSDDNEIAFSSPNAVTDTYDLRNQLKYDIGYAYDNNSGITKLIGTTSEGFGIYQASTRNNNIYGVFNLQDWTGDVPPQNKTADSFTSSQKWTAAEFNALLQ